MAAPAVAEAGMHMGGGPSGGPPQVTGAGAHHGASGGGAGLMAGVILAITGGIRLVRPATRCATPGSCSPPGTVAAASGATAGVPSRSTRNAGTRVPCPEPPGSHRTF
ncbi:MAG: hypothetical protein IT200_04405 [Thermoleophilia bacterium]|nr:hypothetical protein [Thermoleophilia bacterium]